MFDSHFEPDFPLVSSQRKIKQQSCMHEFPASLSIRTNKISNRINQKQIFQTSNALIKEM